MRYIGSKLKLIDFIKEVITSYCGKDLTDKTFCDLFAGTGIVGKSFSPIVKKVIANDLEFYSYVANSVTLNGFDYDCVKKIVEKLNSIKGDNNLPFAQAYSEGGKKGRLFYTAENGAKIAAAREYLETIRESIDERDYFAALLSIIDGSDSVANTTSVYGAYLKQFKPSALMPIKFKVPTTTENANGDRNEVYQANANELIKIICGDILYLDPPYNTRQYSSNYHILNYIAKNIAPETDSVAGVTEHNKSKYSSKANAADELEDLIKNAQFEWIFLSYNNEGTIPIEKIEQILSKYGEYHVEFREHQRYKADSHRRNLLGSDKTIEYIHVLHKNEPKNKEIEPFIAENEPKKSFHSKLVSRNVINASANDGIKEMVVSPLNYMGGKKKLLPVLLQHFPQKIDKFVDLFCGGATVGINVNAKQLVLNDNLPGLVPMFKYFFENNTENIVNYIENTIRENGIDTQNIEAYSNFKKAYNEQLFRNPLDLFILIAFGFNNQVRFNGKGEFNIPFGKNRSGWNPRMRKNLIGFVNALHEAKIDFSKKDFRQFDFSTLNAGDFLYADPPYLASQATYNSGWNEECERQLLSRLSELNSRGIKFALSNVLENNNKENKILKDWIEENGFNVIHLNISYANSAYCRKNKESNTDEVLITNYY